MKTSSLKKCIIACPKKEGYKEICWVTRNCPFIENVHGNFQDLLSYDCIATAGNSFGLMDAGIDLAVLKFFGTHVQERIQAQILADYLGEQPVGTSFLVPTDHPLHRWVAHSPTMRTPLNINGTDNVYLAAWATLLAVRKANDSLGADIETLVFPALGTGTGCVPYIEAGTQIRLAVEHFFNPPRYINPSFAQTRHEKIHYGGKAGFEYPRHNYTD